MRICPKCNSMMSHTYRFSPGEMLELYVCHSCFFETKGKRITSDTFSEEIDNPKLINKAKEHKKTKNKKRKREVK